MKLTAKQLNELRRKAEQLDSFNSITVTVQGDRAVVRNVSNGWTSIDVAARTYAHVTGLEAEVDYQGATSGLIYLRLPAQETK